TGHGVSRRVLLPLRQNTAVKNNPIRKTKPAEKSTGLSAVWARRVIAGLFVSGWEFSAGEDGSSPPFRLGKVIAQAFIRRRAAGCPSP
ncbi:MULTISPECIES: hypothetical protein, partial [unclassified Ensifer]|uniref:hypothetical protein n=1 Tax=unclassified Ensifer TaxID=2633371 RepID=UPI001AEC85F4